MVISARLQVRKRLKIRYFMTTHDESYFSFELNDVTCCNSFNERFRQFKYRSQFVGCKIFSSFLDIDNKILFTSSLERIKTKFLFFSSDLDAINLLNWYKRFINHFQTLYISYFFRILNLATLIKVRKDKQFY